MKCPVCEKSGLPDYTKSHVLCPQCNSNLSGFALIEDTRQVHKATMKRRRRIYLLLISVLIFLLAGSILFPLLPQNDDSKVIQNQDSIIKVLKEDLDARQIEFTELQSPPVSSEEVKIHYIVKDGDNLSKIALFFYNDWKKYNKIAEENNLTRGEIIFPKDTLIITLSIEH